MTIPQLLRDTLSAILTEDDKVVVTLEANESTLKQLSKELREEYDEMRLVVESSQDLDAKLPVVFSALTIPQGTINVVHNDSVRFKLTVN